jgi:3-methyladenine DNA glycosylase/8-oxoguanine DNA glycosylase
VRAICFQQRAGRAATTIHGRFVDQLEGDVTPARVLELEDESFRIAGLSRNKQASILDLAAHVDDGRVQLAHIGRRTDEVIIEQLTAVRGIGRWTVEMFLMFRLGRLDVWPTGDLGVRRGFARMFDLGADPTPKVLAELGEPFRPYRSVVAWYCWRAADQVI